jgi:hypothetical protein
MWVTLGSGRSDFPNSFHKPNHVLTEGILALRTYAFLGRPRWTAVLLSVLFIGEAAFLLYVSIAAVHQTVLPLVKKGPCTASDAPGKHIVSGFWLAPVAFDLLCTFLTLAKVGYAYLSRRVALSKWCYRLLQCVRPGLDLSSCSLPMVSSISWYVLRAQLGMMSIDGSHLVGGCSSQRIECYLHVSTQRQLAKHQLSVCFCDAICIVSDDTVQVFWLWSSPKYCVADWCSTSVQRAAPPKQVCLLISHVTPAASHLDPRSHDGLRSKRLAYLSTVSPSRSKNSTLVSSRRLALVRHWVRMWKAADSSFTFVTLFYYLLVP